MKNLIFGASGYLGNHLYNFLSQKEKKVYGTYFRNKKKGLIYFDISKMKINSLKFIDSIDYAVIMSAVNSNVNDTNKNLNKTLKINLNKTKKLLEDCLKYGLTPVYISSDGVFDGKKGNYEENDVLNSLNHYGKIKKKIEKFIIKKFNNYLIIRVSKVFGLQKNDKTLITSIFNEMKKKRKVFFSDDQFFSPIYVFDLCKYIYFLIKFKNKGIFHLSSIQSTSRYEVAKKIKQKFALKKVKIIRKPINKFNFSEKIPLNTTLNSRKFLKLFKIKPKSINYFLNRI